MENFTKYRGVILEENSDEWIFLGSNSKLDNQVINKDKDWTTYLPSYERQNNGVFDTWNCVAFSACNALETIFKYKIKNKQISVENIKWLKTNGYFINGEINFSDRYVGIKAGTKIGTGNTGGKVAYAIHQNGLIPETLLPYSNGMTAEEYYKGITSEMDNLAEEFNKRFVMNFEAVREQNFNEALEYSPLQVYVYGWLRNNKGIYYNKDKPANHAVEMIKCCTIFDHYEPSIKQLTKDYKYFRSGYKYTITEVIKTMNVDKFLKDNDLLFVRNKKTGQFGRIMHNKLKTVETKDRGVLLLLDEAVRKNGRGLTEEEWNKLPKENF